MWSVYLVTGFSRTQLVFLFCVISAWRIARAHWFQFWFRLRMPPWYRQMWTTAIFFRIGYNSYGLPVRWVPIAEFRTWLRNFCFLPAFRVLSETEAREILSLNRLLEGIFCYLIAKHSVNELCSAIESADHLVTHLYCGDAIKDVLRCCARVAWAALYGGVRY